MSFIILRFRPANILLNERRVPVFVDFGFAEKYDMTSSKAFYSNLMYGTPEVSRFIIHLLLCYVMKLTPIPMCYSTYPPNALAASRMTRGNPTFGPWV